MITVARLVAYISANTHQLDMGVGRARASLGGLSRDATLAGTALTAAFTAPIVAIAKTALEFDDLNKRAGIAFTNVFKVGGQEIEKARRSSKALVEDLKYFAKTTPYEFEELLQFGQRFMAVGVEAKNVVPYLKAIGDQVAQLGGSSEIVGRVVQALGSMLSTSKMTGRALWQLSFAGINGIESLAKAYNVSAFQMRKMITAGLIPAQQAMDILVNYMSKRAPDAMKQMNETLLVGFSNLKDYFTQAVGSLFEQGYAQSVNFILKLQDVFDKAKTAIEGWDEATRARALNSMAVLAALGPAILVITGLGKSLVLLGAGLGPWILGLTAIAFYVAQNATETSKFKDIAQELAPIMQELAQEGFKLFLEVGRALLPVIVALAPILVTLAGVATNLLKSFNELPETTQNVLLFAAGVLYLSSLAAPLALLIFQFVRLQSAIAVFGTARVLTFMGLNAGIPRLLALTSLGVYNIAGAFRAFVNTLQVFFAMGGWSAVFGALRAALTGGLMTALNAVIGALTSIAGLIGVVGAGAIGVGYLAHGIATSSMSEGDAQNKINAMPEIGQFTARIRELKRELAVNPGDWEIINKINSLQKQMHQAWAIFNGDPATAKSLGVAEEITKKIASGISITNIDASCAEFASKFISATGKKIPTIVSAKGLYDYASTHGGTEIDEVAKLKFGDLLTFYGKQYGVMKDAFGKGYHSGVYVGGGKYASNSGGVTKYGTLGPNNMPAHMTSLPDAFTKNKIETEEDIQARIDMTEQLTKRFNDLSDSMAKNNAVAIAGGTAYAAMKWDVTKGNLKDLTEEQKKHLLAMANMDDQYKRTQDTIKAYDAIMKGMRDRARDDSKSIALGVDATTTQKLAWDYARESLSGFTAEQQKAIQTQQKEAIELSRTAENLQTMNALRKEAQLLTILDENKRSVVSNMGFDKWRQLSPVDQQEMLDTDRTIRTIKANEAAARAISSLRFEMAMLGNTTDMAAISAAGGIKDWNLLTDANKGLFRSLIVTNDVMKSFDDKLKGILESNRAIGSENDTATQSMQRFIDQTLRLKGADKSFAGLSDKMKDLMNAAKDTDLRNAFQFLDRFDKDSSRELDTIAKKMAGTYDPATAAVEEWYQQNERYVDLFRELWGDKAGLILDEVARRIKKTFNDKEALKGLAKQRELVAGINRDYVMMSELDPFKQWLMSMYEYNAESGNFEALKGMDPKVLERAFDAKESLKGLQQMKSLFGDLSKRTQIMIASNPFEAWVASLYEINALTGEIQLPKGLSAEKLREFFDADMLLSLVEKVARGIGDVFSNMIYDIQENGFKNMFQNIYWGFQQLLFKMAVEYLQSQLVQALMGLIGGAFGMGGGFGGVGGGAQLNADPGGAGIGASWMAGGGNVYGGQTLIVGEHGMEVFVPRTDGYIIPNGDLQNFGPGRTNQMYELSGGAGNSYIDSNSSNYTGSQNVTHNHYNTYNIQTPDVQGFRRAQSTILVEGMALAERERNRS